MRFVGGVMAAVVVAAGCGSGWRTVDLVREPHAPRPGDRVEVVRTDGATRRGVLSAVDADSLYSEDWAVAWSAVSDVAIVGDEPPVVGRRTRVLLRGGGTREGWLAALRDAEIVLSTTPLDAPLASETLMRLPRHLILRMDQRP